MPASLVTDWKRVAQSGPTIDGRDIKPEWLTEMAETYDPDIYTAKLWIDHRRFMGSYGSVKELKTEKDGDLVRLFAKISPSRDLVERNQLWEDKLHFSIEVNEDFAKTGKFYLGGLAMTDEPASLGTDEMRFSAGPDRRFTARFPGDEVEGLFSNMEDEQAQNFFRRLMQAFSQVSKPKQKDEDPMDKLQFEELKGSIEQTNQAVAGLAETVSAFVSGQKQDDSDDGQHEEAHGDDTPPAGDDQFTELKTGLDDLGQKFDTLVTRMEKAVPGTSFNESTGPAGDQDDLL